MWSFFLRGGPASLPHSAANKQRKNERVFKQADEKETLAARKVLGRIHTRLDATTQTTNIMFLQINFPESNVKKNNNAYFCSFFVMTVQSQMHR